LRIGDIAAVDGPGRARSGSVGRVVDQVTATVRARTSERSRADLVAVAGAAGLVAVAAVVGALLSRSGVGVHAPAAPFFARFGPHLGPGTPLALGVAALVVGYGPAVAQRRRWGSALAAATAAGLAWTVSLALVGGWQGVVGPLSTPFEYLIDVPRVGALSDVVRTYAAAIPAGSPMPWHTHAAGHPPGMLLVFVVLSRIGLPGPGPAAALCLAAAAAVVPLVAVTVRSLSGEAVARRALPFLVLTPTAIWAGVSADAVIAAVGALGLLLLARALTRDGGSAAIHAVAAGAVLGMVCFLTYGGGLFAVPALALIAVFGRWRLVAAVAAGGVAVAGLWALAGFAWWEGFAAVHERYLAGYGGTRPYAYWSWADLAVLAVAAGPAVVAGLARLVRLPLALRAGLDPALTALVGGSLAAMLLAALSGMSKGEVERIWLPWTVWLPVVAVLLPGSRRHRWLAAQAAVALLLEHLLITPW
jgi:methylthioxylose transferase